MSQKRLSVNYGSFSCIVEGMDDPVEVLRQVFDLCREASAGNPAFGAPELSALAPEARAAMVERLERRMMALGAAVGATPGDDAIVIHPAEPSAQEGEGPPAPRAGALGAGPAVEDAQEAAAQERDDAAREAFAAAIEDAQDRNARDLAAGKAGDVPPADAPLAAPEDGAALPKGRADAPDAADAQAHAAARSQADAAADAGAADAPAAEAARPATEAGPPSGGDAAPDAPQPGPQHAAPPPGAPPAPDPARQPAPSANAAPGADADAPPHQAARPDDGAAGEPIDPARLAKARDAFAQGAALGPRAPRPEASPKPAARGGGLLSRLIGRRPPPEPEPPAAPGPAPESRPERPRPDPARVLADVPGVPISSIPEDIEARLDEFFSRPARAPKSGEGEAAARAAQTPRDGEAPPAATPRSPSGAAPDAAPHPDPNPGPNPAPNPDPHPGPERPPQAPAADPASDHAPTDRAASDRAPKAPPPQSAEPPRPEAPRPSAQAVMRAHTPSLDEAVRRGEPISLEQFVRHVEAEDLADQMEAAAAYATLLRDTPLFTRSDLIAMLAGLEEAHAFGPEDRVRAFGKLIRTGVLVRVDGDRFAMNEKTLREYERVLGL
ncbi:hypothetical protein [Oceanicella actignis]|uniref:hypothetical protein n=1 Tax=Oceanicella actignis TaxID=1189325 RepID=UPI0011E6309A|nr:hypothetical protein [Oceanicella actignis]TYO91500.1 Meckel syndrome type 1 protein [Oceanicella actignis]